MPEIEVKSGNCKHLCKQNDLYLPDRGSTTVLERKTKKQTLVRFPTRESRANSRNRVQAYIASSTSLVGTDSVPVARVPKVW